jgi:hypothetical protein
MQAPGHPSNVCPSILPCCGYRHLIGHRTGAQTHCWIFNMAPPPRAHMHTGHPHLRHVADEVDVDESGDEAAPARLERPPPQAVPHHGNLHAAGEDKGAQQAAHGDVVPPGALAVSRAVHRGKPHDQQDAPHLERRQERATPCCKEGSRA